MRRSNSIAGSFAAFAVWRIYNVEIFITLLLIFVVIAFVYMALSADRRMK